MHHWNHGTLDENHFHVWTVSWGRPYTENTCCILSTQKNRNNQTWEKFRQQRNFVNKLKRKFTKTYFLERCSGGTKTTDVWNTVKPFFSKKCQSGDQKIILCEDNKVINNSNEVSNLFNNFFATVAEKIGENVVYDPSNHPSITAIHENNSIELNGKFGFQKVTSEKVEKNHK